MLWNSSNVTAIIGSEQTISSSGHCGGLVSRRNLTGCSRAFKWTTLVIRTCVWSAEKRWTIRSLERSNMFTSWLLTFDLEKIEQIKREDWLVAWFYMQKMLEYPIHSENARYSTTAVMRRCISSFKAPCSVTQSWHTHSWQFSEGFYNAQNVQNIVHQGVHQFNPSNLFFFYVKKALPAVAVAEVPPKTTGQPLRLWFGGRFLPFGRDKEAHFSRKSRRTCHGTHGVEAC